MLGAHMWVFAPLKRILCSVFDESYVRVSLCKCRRHRSHTEKCVAERLPDRESPRGQGLVPRNSLKRKALGVTRQCVVGLN